MKTILEFIDKKKVINIDKIFVYSYKPHDVLAFKENIRYVLCETEHDINIFINALIENENLDANLENTKKNLVETLQKNKERHDNAGIMITLNEKPAMSNKFDYVRYTTVHNISNDKQTCEVSSYEHLIHTADITLDEFNQKYWMENNWCKNIY